MPRDSLVRGIRDQVLNQVSMVHFLQRRFGFALAVSTFAAACGLLAGVLLEAGVSIRLSMQKLDRDAQRLVAEDDRVHLEVLATLRVLSGSTLPICSEAELATFRMLIFQTEFLRDAGRMRDGRLVCSAILGKDNLPATHFKPVATSPEGTSLYADVSAYPSQDRRIAVLQLGDYYAVVDPAFAARQDLINNKRVFTLLDAVTHRPVSPDRQLPVAGDWIVNSDAQGRVAEFYFATRCSSRFSVCMTTYASVPDVLRERRNQMILSASLGTAAGALFGFLCTLLYLRSRSMVQQLRRAIAKDRVRMVYQPIVDLTTGHITGAEALARWNDEEGNAISPDVFVKVAEEGEFIGALTRLALRHCLRDFGDALRDRPDFHLSVNVSAFDLADYGFPAMLEEMLRNAGVVPMSLALEVTESATANNDRVKQSIGRLHHMGCAVHIDDFGTGYSSLSYLHSLAIDAIKIDRSFTNAIGTEAVTVSILPQLLAIAQKLQLLVIVEGVESEMQVDYFRKYTQPVLAQGWYFGRPVPAESFHELLAHEHQNEAAV